MRLALCWTRGIPEQLVEGSWARQERKMKIDLGAKEEVSERRERNFVKRCIDSVSTEFFLPFSSRRGVGELWQFLE